MLATSAARQVLEVGKIIDPFFLMRARQLNEDKKKPGDFISEEFLDCHIRYNTLWMAGMIKVVGDFLKAFLDASLMFLI